ncbi:MAG: DUF58 domain-containing protein [Desulfobacterales bacterium]|jgi:uncharacterized protein (DUF58 family)|nr:DUF58 domain-containing protein [Desulfobacterales bacterium]
MISKELARKIRYIQIYTSKAVNDALAGEYQSIFKGRGMAFSEVREYQIGDDIRTIDWNVTARTGMPHVKLFIEERELTVLFLVDLSASGSFGSIRQTKNEVAAELCALLSFSAIKNNDKVGLVLFTDRVEKFIPPAKGTTHVLRIIRELLEFKPSHPNTDISGALEFLGHVTHKKCVVFLISDFLGHGYDRSIRVMGKQHDLIAVSVADPREISMPDVGLIELEDAETGEQILIDTSSIAVRHQYEQFGASRLEGLRKLFRSINVDHMELLNGQDYVLELVRFFKKRERRLR